MRRSGILLPIFSLCGPYGIGTLGHEAYNFVDFLKNSGQAYWQILPLNPTTYGNSPYQSPCVFAGNPYFISPDFLIRDSLLKEEDAACLKTENNGRINYSEIYKTRLKILKKAANNISDTDRELLKFESENSFWLNDYATFSALKELNNMSSHEKWKIKELSPVQQKSEEKLHRKIQFLFFSQWLALKKYANAKGVHIIGDLPIYPSKDSSDYYFNKNLYLKNVVAACPPDEFNSKGQLWGNPIYNWQAMKNDGFSWWKERLKQASKIFDTIRIDHFRGIYEYYSVKADSLNAVQGHWNKGAGMKFVNMIKESFPHLEVIAEDLGFLNHEVKDFFARSGFPGMKILQFAFDGSDSEYLPHNYTKACVAYTGTHDNPTVMQWLQRAKESEIINAMNYLGAPNKYALCESCIRAVMASVSDLSIIPLQDWLHLGAEARINTPGTLENNWCWRINENALSNNLTEKILHYTKTYKRAKEQTQ